MCESVGVGNGHGVGDSREGELVGAVHRAPDRPARRVRLDESAAFDEAGCIRPAGAEEDGHEHLGVLFRFFYSTSHLNTISY